jgi:hypothetical protein
MFGWGKKPPPTRGGSGMLFERWNNAADAKMARELTDKYFDVNYDGFTGKGLAGFEALFKDRPSLTLVALCDNIKDREMPGHIDYVFKYWFRRMPEAAREELTWYYMEAYYGVK